MQKGEKRGATKRVKEFFVTSDLDPVYTRDQIHIRVCFVVGFDVFIF